MKEVYQTSVDLTRRKLFMGDDAATAEPGGEVPAKPLELAATHKDEANADLPTSIEGEF